LREKYQVYQQEKILPSWTGQSSNPVLFLLYVKFELNKIFGFTLWIIKSDSRHFYSFCKDYDKNHIMLIKTIASAHCSLHLKAERQSKANYSRQFSLFSLTIMTKTMQYRRTLLMQPFISS